MGQVKEPAIVFHLMDSSISLLNENTNEYKGIAKIEATVKDMKFWEDIVARLNGMTLYRGDDIKTELIGILKEEKAGLETKLTEEQIASNSAMEHIKQRSSILESENKRLEDRVKVLQNLLELYEKHG